MILNIGKLIKEYEDGLSSDSFYNEEHEKLYSINEIIELYPMLSKHIITNAINDGEINVTWIGNKRCFSLNDVDSYLKHKQEKADNVSESIKSWRNH